MIGQLGNAKGSHVSTVSVVIRALNEEKHIGRLLSGLERQSRLPDEIILVDSGSTDATCDIARHYGARVVHIAPELFSFGRALNVGCADATSDLLVFVSAHVYPVYDSFIECLVAPFDNPSVALSYGRQIGDHRTKYSESRIMLQWFPEISIERQDHPFCNNANAAIRRSLWQSDPYDEELTGLEDLEWASRAQAKGHRIAYVAEAPVVHVHEESWSGVANRYRREAIAYTKILGDDARVGSVESLRLLVSNIGSDVWHAFRDRELASNGPGIFRFRFAQFWGAWQGSRQTQPVSAQLRRRFYYPAARTDVSRRAVTPGVRLDYEAGESVRGRDS